MKAIPLLLSFVRNAPQKQIATIFPLFYYSQHNASSSSSKVTNLWFLLLFYYRRTRNTTMLFPFYIRFDPSQRQIGEAEAIGEERGKFLMLFPVYGRYDSPSLRMQYVRARFLLGYLHCRTQDVRNGKKRSSSLSFFF